MRYFDMQRKKGKEKSFFYHKGGQCCLMYQSILTADKR